MLVCVRKVKNMQTKNIAFGFEAPAKHKMEGNFPPHFHCFRPISWLKSWIESSITFSVKWKRYDSRETKSLEKEAIRVNDKITIFVSRTQNSRDMLQKAWFSVLRAARYHFYLWKLRVEKWSATVTDFQQRNRVIHIFKRAFFDWVS